MKSPSANKMSERLVGDLATGEKLQYPNVTLKQLNEYVMENGPIINPVFGKQVGFCIHQAATCGGVWLVVAATIAQHINNWAGYSVYGGRVTTSQGAFILGNDRDVRMPDVAYIPREVHRNLMPAQMRSNRGELFDLTFVVEIDELSGQGSQLQNLDRKMRNYYFDNGVQLGWLIDPRPNGRIMYDYFLDEHGELKCSSNSVWRNLDGRNELPEFILYSEVLDMALN
ncbi:hypothetical protein THRCLA_21517 [Thraustotheca clavata]|uniref:Putative restriction endonuclease domain-containing protein n=1 Tax=Thraustotheca clavata TaxID=74557 RepID=A0A1V9ZVL0_9STRA|nr:hypothetical protein THRCLA_21517 [Thraustotheca clavata]